MTENVENPILEHLRAIRTDVGTINVQGATLYFDFFQSGATTTNAASGTITGVNARASSPSSTPSRTISNAFPLEKKFGPGRYWWCNHDGLGRIQHKR